MTDTNSSTYWSSDVRASMPVPSPHPRGVEMGGFVFTAGGLAHEISDAEFTRLSTPDFHPGDSLPEVEYEDLDLDEEPSINLGVF